MSLAFPFCICSILQTLPKFKSFAPRNLSRWKNEGGFFKVQVINSYEIYESIAIQRSSQNLHRTALCLFTSP